MPDQTAIVLHPSRARLALTYSAPLLLLGLAALALAGGGAEGGTLVLLAVGALLGLVVLVDVPLHVEFDEEGVTRVCAVRRQRLAWSTVVAVSRTASRPGLGELLGRRGAGGAAARRAGLVVRRGARGNVLLVDRCESHAEWTAVRDLLRDRATAFSAPPPPTDHPPAGRGPRALHVRID
jgi:hypothetical protein